MNILFVSSEVAPFAKTGGLGDVSGALPVALNEAGAHCTVITPLYKLVRKNGYRPVPVKRGIGLVMGGKRYSFDLSVIERKGTKFYFVGNEKLYGREAIYGSQTGDYEDSHIRYGLLSKAALASIPYIGTPDVIHCNDWHTGLIPLYIKTLKSFKKIRALFTIHNIAYQGLFPSKFLSSLDIPRRLFTDDGAAFFGKIGFLKTGIVFSDAVTTVSDGYKKEILTKEFGCGLNSILKRRGKDFYSIINGADYSTWDPETDKHIAKNYGPDTLDLKLECKKDLMKYVGLPFDKDAPVIGMVTRLARQKGVDIVAEAADDIVRLGARLIVLGSGEERYNKIFRDLGRRYKTEVATSMGFDEPLAHKIEAGSDIFLMPSRYEPCGLNQIYSLKYGTVPVVRATGGLDDTIDDFDPKGLKGNGFKFKDAEADSMVSAIERSTDLFRDKKRWRILQKNGMACDFSWARSAAKYIKLYEAIMRKKG